ncbi:hypothetical protein ACFKFF_004957, partial [Escherichia coli]
MLLISDNIRYGFIINDENHIWYDFMCVFYYHIICVFSAAQIRFPAVQDLLLPPPQRHLPSAQHVVPDSAADDTICCVISLTCDASRRGGKQRYD